MKIINVSSEVYEVFEMTGFTEMMTIEKAYRVLSIEGCEAIGEGSNGIVYRLDPDTIVKVYRNPDSLPDIKRERELARTALILGINTAIPYDVAKVGNSYGSVFELLNAKSFSKLIKEDPENLDKYVSMYVKLLKQIHSTKVKETDMPDAKKIAINWAKFLKDYLPEDQYSKLITLFENIPERTTMIHGDYHIKNIMMQNGEVLLIDMDTLSYGHPIIELAQIYLSFIGFGEIDHEESINFQGLPYETLGLFFKKVMHEYLNTTDEALINSVILKASIIAYTRYMRRTIKRIGIDTPKGKPIVDLCNKRLADALPKVDTLDF